ncbi:septation protein SepH [Corynebacterium sanguinis]|uniref:DUF3071 domain-containing protein n=1 Tax=Corynebacterium sanguinis TaxID=2594913 RepID=A0A6C1TV21_9CORY|nr:MULTISPECIES: septation protein SepH [Corynebacterium]MBA4505858.1 DUF3071 domain-containing protein [Corynebacterium sanguinis]MCT1411796.1 septation protein SepH [Corynebacterium sanguinis]MCT1426647.1 septation protein SepH [Corynebacterium sanguinis]MCT1444324.1 septation protein SepH [Corynebacterium sanguinis]MCT1499691.1 septation protein SepH [Corynebacterium sanguinis]
MRELYAVAEESTETFLVMRDADGVRYQLARAQLHSLHGPAEHDAEPLDVEVVEAEVEPSDTPTYDSLPRVPSLPDPDPLFATPLSMRPSEIQAKIRAGATQKELADEMGVAESRIEAYAHPVLLERYQVAEAAKQSHPLREGGPAKLTLFEILATAFAARGNSLSHAEWDATREPGDDWVVHVRWKSGLSENEGLWSFKRAMGAKATTQPRNSVAADLTDPDFVQPIRSLTAVEPDTPQLLEPEAGTDDSPVVEGDFLRHPDGDEQPQQRRRKAVTPHWEDVLLGVRTNTKRPRK